MDDFSRYFTSPYSKDFRRRASPDDLTELEQGYRVASAQQEEDQGLSVLIDLTLEHDTC